MAAYRDANMAVQNRITPYQFWYSSLFEIGFAAVLLVGSALFAAGSLEGMTLLLFMIVMLGLFEPIPLLDYTVGAARVISCGGQIVRGAG